jgi:glycosyltransferase involved in cell wall biosynthesis
MPKLEMEPTSTVERGPPGGLPRRVLHVMNAAGGGAALSTIDLIRSFRELGVDSVAVCHDMGSEAEHRLVAEAVEGRVLFTPLYWWNRKSRVAAWKRPILELLQLRATGWRRGSERRLAAFAERHQPDLIHTNTFVNPEGGRVARRLGLPHVWHVRELVGRGAPFRFAREGRAMREYLARHASLVVANSRVTAERMRSWVPEGMLRTVANGIDVDRFAAIMSQRRSARSGPLVVGLVANLTSWKKHDLFLDVARRLAPRTSLEFHIFGHLPSDSKLDRLRDRLGRDGLSNRVRLRGFVPDPVRIMSEVDIVVHPSDHESFGRLLVEAMAAGVPVVGVRGGGAAEIVDDGVTGLLAPPDDAAALADCVERLAADAELRVALGEAGRRRAREKYSLARCVGQTADVYREAMKRPLSPTAGAARP